MRRLSLLLLLVGLVNATPAIAGVRVEGRLVDQSGLALPGVAVRLSRASTPASAEVAAGEDVVTSADGAFAFDVEPGTYQLTAALDGFQPVSREVRVTASLVLPDVVMSLAPFSQETTVVAVVPTDVQPHQFGAPATIAAQVIENAPSRTNRYDDVLPLVPNVVRGPDGLVSVAGARAPQGVVLVNGAPASDVATGDPVAAVPLGAVETVQVITTGFPAEFGASTGGVTLINSRAGSDDLHFTINSFTPRPRLADGGVQGIEAWEPNSSIRGPIVKGRAWFAQSLDFRFERTRADTVNGSQDRRQHGFTSFSQVDARARDGHVLSAWVNARKEHVDGERLGAFTPLGTVPDVDRSSVGGALVDRAASGFSTMETRVTYRRDGAALAPSGTGEYSVGHDVTRGAYFGSGDRHAWNAEASSVLSRTWSRHLLKAGASVSRRELDGWESNRSVTYLRSDLTPALEVEFVGAGRYRGASTQAGLFVQDSWDLGAGVRLDTGARLDWDSRARAVASPRAGVTWALSPRATITAGIGSFSANVPLTALAFDGYQSRRALAFDASGQPAAQPITFWNTTDSDLAQSRARISSVKFDWRPAPAWQLRVGFQERRGTHEAIVTPLATAAGLTALLATTGDSSSRSFESTVGYRPVGRPHQLYVSYVRSKSRGQTNDVAQFEGLFKDPRLDASETAALPADVPHRMLAWGVFSLPLQITVAPFLDVRSGFPYSAVRDDWSYAEARYSRRYPLFASLDLVVTKIVTLPGGTRARLGIKLYNIAGRRNGREVQTDLDRMDFGQTYNALGRQVRGVFEIIWSGHAK